MWRNLKSKIILNWGFFKIYDFLYIFKDCNVIECLLRLSMPQVIFTMYYESWFELQPLKIILVMIHIIHYVSYYIKHMSLMPSTMTVGLWSCCMAILAIFDNVDMGMTTYLLNTKLWFVWNALVLVLVIKGMKSKCLILSCWIPTLILSSGI